MRRVLNVIHYPVFGGPHNQALRLTAPLQDRGWETVVLIPDEPGNAAERLRNGGVEVVRIPLHRLRAVRDPRLHVQYVVRIGPEVRAIRRVIRDRSVDVVQIGGLVNPHAAIAARLEHVPVVWQLLDTRAPMPVGIAATALVRELADVVMSTGRSVAVAYPGGRALRHRLVPFFPPVDIDLFRPRPDERDAVRSALGIPAGSQVVGCVANVNPQKGIVELVRAFADVRHAVPLARLVLVGAEYRTHASYSARVRAAMDTAGLSEGRDVIFMGERVDVERLLAGFDVFAFAPVPRGEGVSTVVLEAMSAGLPVVTTSVAGLPEAIVDGETGRLVPPLDTRSMADAIVDLLTSPAARARMGAAARRHAVARFGTSRCVDDHVRAYSLALRRNGARRAKSASFPGTLKSRVVCSSRRGSLSPVTGGNQDPRSYVEPANPIRGRSDGPRKPRVVYWNNIPTPYMVDRFNAVADRDNLEFEAWFSTRTEPDRRWVVDEASWRFRYRYLPGIGLGQRRVELPIGLLHGRRPDLIVSLYASPSFLLGRLLACAGGVKVAFWTEITFDAWITRRRWKEALKRAVFPTLDGVITAGQDGTRFARRYGIPADRISLVPHAIDVEGFTTMSAAARQDRDALRSRLGVSGCTFLYVGRLWRGKGLDYLVEAFGTVSRNASAQVSLLVVGDGPDETRLRHRVAALNLSNVVFAGFRPAEDLPAYLAASDVFVFPTLGDPYGLVLDEAMACSLPLISTSAAGELELRIAPGRNGLIVPPADAAALAAAMSELESDPDRRAKMGAESRRRVSGRTPERWAEDFERAAGAILAGEPAVGVPSDPRGPRPPASRSGPAGRPSGPD